MIDLGRNQFESTTIEAFNLEEHISSVSPIWDVNSKTNSSSSELQQMMDNMPFNSPIPGTLKWDNLAHTSVASPKVADVFSCLSKYLQSFNVQKQRFQFMNIVFSIFGIERLTDRDFVAFLASQLNFHYSNFKRSLDRWIGSGLKEVRGRKALSDVIKQKIYNTWVENSITSTGNRNDRCSVKISKLEYTKRYGKIGHKEITLEERTNKRGRINYVANRMICHPQQLGQ